ncbi:MAG: hypothetical protein HZB17_02380 [Chloroflexi bacterium]|nr:hypothetical protein [Chloroflexota bacterium]
MSGIAIFVLITGIAIGMGIIAFAFRLRQIEKEDETQNDPNHLASLLTAAPPLTVEPSSTVTPPIPAETNSPTPLPSWLSSLKSNLQPTLSTLASNIPTAIKKEPELPELARLYVSPSGRLIIEVNGARFSNIKEITDPTIARSLKTLVDEMNRFFGVNLVSADPTAPPVPILTTPDPVLPPHTPTPPVMNRPVKVVSVEEAKNLPLEKPSMDIFKQYRNLREREKQPQIKIRSVLEEIDEILQAKIAGTDFTRRGLKVSTHSDGTALFVLDGTGYPGVDELPDDLARSLVQQSVQEWEKK